MPSTNLGPACGEVVREGVVTRSARRLADFRPPRLATRVNLVPAALSATHKYGGDEVGPWNIREKGAGKGKGGGPLTVPEVYQ